MNYFWEKLMVEALASPPSDAGSSTFLRQTPGLRILFASCFNRKGPMPKYFAAFHYPSGITELHRCFESASRNKR